MSQNPFASPESSSYSAHDPQLGGTGTFDIGQCISDAWKNVWASFPLWLGVGLVGVIVAMLGYVTIIGIFIVLPVLAWGGVKFVLNMHDGRAEFGDLFAGFSRFGQALGGMLLYGVCMFGLAIVGQAVQLVGTFAESPVLAGLGLLVNLAFTLAVTMRFYFAPFFIVDQDMGAIDAMRASWQASSKQLLNVFLLTLVAGLIAAAGLIALIIGIFVTATMAYLMYASAYRQIVGAAPRRMY